MGSLRNAACLKKKYEYIYMCTYIRSYVLCIFCCGMVFWPLSQFGPFDADNVKLLVYRSFTLTLHLHKNILILFPKRTFYLPRTCPKICLCHPFDPICSSILCPSMNNDFCFCCGFKVVRTRQEIIEVGINRGIKTHGNRLRALDNKFPSPTIPI